jgi:hypothetical protein
MLGRERGRGRRPQAHALGWLPATQGLRRGGGARGGERRLLTGGACALGALIVPRSCRTACLPARPPPVRRVSRRESGGGSGACGRSRGLLFVPLPFTPISLSPSHPFHPPIPAPSPSRPTHSEQECPARNNPAAPRWLWSRFSGRLPPAPPPAPVPRWVPPGCRSACFCHCGSALAQRVPPNATAHAPFPGLGTGLPWTPHTLVFQMRGRNYETSISAPITLRTQPLAALAP